MLEKITEIVGKAIRRVLENGVTDFVKQLAKDIAEYFTGDASSEIRKDASKLAEDYVNELAAMIKEGIVLAALPNKYAPAVALITKEVPNVADLAYRTYRLRQAHTAEMATQAEASSPRRLTAAAA